jgi:hypothetical protein
MNREKPGDHVEFEYDRLYDELLELEKAAKQFSLTALQFMWGMRF